MATAAAALLARTLAGMPRDQHSLLVSSGQSQPAPFDRASFERVQDVDWLEYQLDLQAQRWPSVDRRVLATLWWYSVSQVFLTPTLASLFVTGCALSPRPADVELHCLPDGRIFTARSTAVLVESDVVDSVAAALRDGLAMAIPEVARAGATRERPLWALATDSLANRLLWLGRTSGAVDRATSLATTLVQLIGPPMPAPRYVDIQRRPPRAGTVRFVRRGSCCLVYLEPGEAKCASCPRISPVSREALLTTAADGA
ncbi:MAG: (2Fe-2S)-binding protein [Geodermatophilaceae bacterium]|nr:(2Fe-2S)-binding protein [Geodermatophilaceae bacterium]